MAKTVKSTTALDRHCKRMGKSLAEITLSGGALPLPSFPRIPLAFQARKVVFDSVIKTKPPENPVHCLFVEGVLVEISPWAVDIDNALKQTASFHAYTHEKLFPNGRRELLASRATN